MAETQHHVFVLRHATTEWSSAGKHTSRTDVPLTPQGAEVAVRAGATLAALRDGAPPAVLASPRVRAQRTAYLAGLADVVIEPLLAEWDYGEYEGLTTPEIRGRVPGWTVWTHSCPGGESAEDVRGRADALLTNVSAELHRRDVVLVGHGHFGRCLVARWLGMDVTAGVRFALDPGGIVVLGHERGVPQLTKSNLLSSLANQQG